MTYRILELFIKTLLWISVLAPAILVRAQTVSQPSAAELLIFYFINVTLTIYSH
jgi:hypothetical protein